MDCPAAAAFQGLMPGTARAQTGTCWPTARLRPQAQPGLSGRVQESSQPGGSSVTAWRRLAGIFLTRRYAPVRIFATAGQPRAIRILSGRRAQVKKVRYAIGALGMAPALALP